jgi:hypothetical protein
MEEKRREAAALPMRLLGAKGFDGVDGGGAA